MEIMMPNPDVLPAHWGWFQSLLLVTLPLHLLAMNGLVGGLVIAFYLQLRGGQLRYRLAHKIALVLPLVIAFVVNLGVAPLLFMQMVYGHLFYTSSILMGIFWLGIIPVMIVAYYGAYLWDFRFSRLGRLGLPVTLVVLVCVLGIGFLFTTNMLLMTLPEQFAAYFNHRDGTFLLQGRGERWPRYLHMMTGAVAVGGLLVACLANYFKKRDPELQGYGQQLGMRTFVLFTLINSVLGLWYLTSLPATGRSMFLGGNLGATALFILALLLLAGALWWGLRGHLLQTVAHGLGLMVVMSLMRSWLRSEYLRDVFTLDELVVSPQYSSLILFLVVCAFAIVAISWMVKKAFAALEKDPEKPVLDKVV